MNKTFVAGVAHSVITPPLGTLLYGYPRERPASVVLDDLRATIAVFGYEKPNACLINLDLCSINNSQVKYLSEIIEKETGIPKNNVIISCTHTHSGPCITGAPGWGGSDENYLNNTLYPSIINTTKEAANALVPVKMGIATTPCSTGVNRRQISKEGEILFGQRPYGTNDPTMTVIAFKNAETNEPALNIVHYSCHGTGMGGFSFELSRDWCGHMVDALEEESKATTLFINGSIGDTGPRLSNGRTGGDAKLCREVGLIAADCAVKAYNEISAYEDVAFETAVDKIAIPYRELESLEEIEANLERLNNMDNPQGMDLILQRAMNARKEIYDSGIQPETHMHLDQVIFKFNNLVLVPFQFEIFSEIALRLREYSPAEHTLSISNANGALGYFPSKGEILRGGYEVDMFFIRQTYAPVNNADDFIINENLRIIEKMFN